MRSAQTLLLGVGSSLLIASCSKSDQTTPTPTPPPAANRVILTPDDLVTDTGGGSLMVSFDSVPTDDDAQRIASSVELRVYPEKTSVPTTTVVRTTTLTGVPTDPSDQSQPLRKFIQVTPQSSLGDRWFVLVVKALPAGFASGSQLAGTSQLGAVVSRFRPGSAPVVRQVRLAKGSSVEVVLSEGVVVNPQALGSQIRVGDVNGSTCALEPPTSLAQPVTSIGFNCPSIVWSTPRVHFELHPGLRAPNGTALGIFEIAACSPDTVVNTKDFVADLDFSTGQPCSTDCREVTPTSSGFCE